jgi:hypothetical protein
MHMTESETEGQSTPFSLGFPGIRVVVITLNGVKGGVAAQNQMNYNL